VVMQIEKAFCVLEYARTQSIVTLQRRFRTKFGNDPPVKESIKQWYEKFQCDGCQYRKTPRLTRPFRGEGEVCEGGVSTQPP
jgi:hypothetical protein